MTKVNNRKHDHVASILLNSLKDDVNFISKNRIHTSHKTDCISIIKTNWLMLVTANADTSKGGGEVD
jgi:hypothetical protein